MATQLVPIIWQKRLPKKTSATDTTLTHTTVKRLWFMPIKKSTIDYFSIDPKFDEPSAEWKAAFDKQYAGEGNLPFFKQEGYQRQYFTGANDATGAAKAVRDQTRAKALSEGVGSTVQAVLKIVAKSKAAKSGKELNRSVTFSFPTFFTRLMIVQAVSSLIQAQADKAFAFITINNVKYPISPSIYDAVLTGADCGAWLAKTIPTGLTEEDPQVKGDEPKPPTKGTRGQQNNG